MSKHFMAAAAVFWLSILIVSTGKIYAEGEDEAASPETDWKQEISSDKQAIQEQRQEMRSDAKEAGQEEAGLLKQIEEARQAGDFEKVKQLRDQLHAAHQENVAEHKADKEALRQSIKELKADVHQARQEGALPRRPLNPPGYNPPGVGPGNPPGYNPPGVGAPARERDRIEDVRDRREDIRDRREDVRDRREDVLDRREDVWDATHNAPPGTPAYRRDKLEDIRDRREDVLDKREDIRDRREDVRDRREDIHDHGLHRGDERGVRDHGQGLGTGRGQGGAHRPQGAGPRGGSRRK